MRSGPTIYANQPDFACAFSVAAGAITANTSFRKNCSVAWTAAGIYTVTLGQGGIIDNRMFATFSGSFVGAVGAFMNVVSTDDNVKVCKFFDAGAAAIEAITIRIVFYTLILS